MNSEKDELSRFRQATLKHQWKEAYTIASTLFAEDIPTYTIFIAKQMMRSHLRFRPYYDLEWIPVFAQKVIGFIQERDTADKAPDLSDEAHRTFADAPFGLTSLVSGAFELRKSLSASNDTGVKAQYLAYALDRFITSEISNYWEAVHPDEVQLRNTFWDSPTTADGKKVLPADVDKAKMYRGIGFLKQPESHGYKSARLLSLADEIELILDSE